MPSNLLQDTGSGNGTRQYLTPRDYVKPCCQCTGTCLRLGPKTPASIASITKRQTAVGTRPNIFILHQSQHAWPYMAVKLTGVGVNVGCTQVRRSSALVEAVVPSEQVDVSQLVPSHFFVYRRIYDT